MNLKGSENGAYSSVKYLGILGGIFTLIAHK